MFAPTHPEHRAAVETAVKFQVPAEPAQVGGSLDAIPLRQWTRDHAVDLLRLLARAGPVAAEARADVLERLDGEDADPDGTIRRQRVVTALRVRLEARGASLAINPQRKVDAVPPPEAVAQIRRVLKVGSDVTSSDIGRYYAERKSADDGAADVAALRAVGATETAAVLQHVLDTVGPSGFAKGSRNRVQAVRDLGQETVVRLNDEIQNPPEDLFILVLRHQLRHADAVRQWAAGTREAVDAKRASEGFGNLDPRLAEIDVGVYFLYLPPRRQE